MVTIVNQSVQGRARFKVFGLYRSEPFENYLASKLILLEGIDEVRTSTLTGNILVFFNSSNSPQCIAVHIERLVIEYQKNDHIQAKYAQEGRKQIEPSVKKEAPVPVSQRQLRKSIILF